MDTNQTSMGPETKEFPVEDGINRMYAVMYQFAQRVAYNDASTSEVVFMTSVFGLIERRGDWNLGIRYFVE